MVKIVQKFKIENKEIIFRYPKEKDAPDMVKLVSSFVEEKAMVGQDKKPTLKEIKETLDKKLKGIKNKKIVYLVVEVDKKVKGRAWVGAKDYPQKHIGNLVIHLSSELRSKGIGDKLMKAVIKEAKKILKVRMITLAVMVQNKPAIGLYKKNGFIKNGLLKNGLDYYGKLVDDVLMVKYL